MPENPWTHQAYTTRVVTLPAPLHENSGWVSWSNPLCLLEYLEKTKESSKFRRMQSTLSFLLLTAAEFTTCSVWPLNMLATAWLFLMSQETYGDTKVCVLPLSLSAEATTGLLWEVFGRMQTAQLFHPILLFRCTKVWVILWLLALNFIHKYWCWHTSKNITLKPQLMHLTFFCHGPY